MLDDAVLALAGNKCDLPDHEVDRAEAEEFARENNLFYMETSAKTGENIKELFEEIAVRIPKAPPAENKNPKLSAEPQQPANGGRCC